MNKIEGVYQFFTEEIKLKKGYAGLRADRKPFFEIVKFDERNTVKSFINAVASDTMDEAAFYLSKKLHTADSVDFQRLKTIMNGFAGFKCVETRTVGRFGSALKTTAVIMKSGKNTLLQFYMAREPDKYGQWKIYGIEREEMY